MLLEHLVIVRKCRTVTLHVKTDNYLAIRLYQRFGFITKEFLPKHYYFDNARHDAYLLELDCDTVDFSATSSAPAAAADNSSSSSSSSSAASKDSAFHMGTVVDSETKGGWGPCCIQ